MIMFVFHLFISFIFSGGDIADEDEDRVTIRPVMNYMLCLWIERFVRPSPNKQTHNIIMMMAISMVF